MIKRKLQANIRFSCILCQKCKLFYVMLHYQSHLIIIIDILLTNEKLTSIIQYITPFFEVLYP